DKIKGFFANCNIQFPKIKLPHFSIKGSFSLSPPSVPKLGIDWYGKAMRGGMILDSPTIFGSMNGKLLGAGEAGKEAVVGVNSLRQMIQSAVHSAAGPAAENPEIDYQRMGQEMRQALASRTWSWWAAGSCREKSAGCLWTRTTLWRLQRGHEMFDVIIDNRSMNDAGLKVASRPLVLSPEKKYQTRTALN
ncbi:hypothetical protein, partial [Faecalibaculum rodentium]|uniref:hypothetical protein n=1 Tax=Faecalibaculum rodentium TaxID=1702221 RepID=UPI0025A9A72F